MVNEGLKKVRVAMSTEKIVVGGEDVCYPERPIRKFLIFNFFDGVLFRGIPMYVQNFRVALEREGIVCREVRCPAMLRRLPRRWLNLIFVLWEQAIVPVLGLAFDCTIYPHNSASVLGSLLGDSLLVVHDLIPNSRRNKKLAARYIRISQIIHARLGGDIAYVSRTSERIGRLAGLFPRSKSFLFPNGLFRFTKEMEPISKAREEHVLLCTGWSANKDLPGALNLYRESGLCWKRTLRILGISGRQEAVDTFCATYPDIAHRITVLPRLEDAAVGEEYRESAWVWVHSKKEGYGRSLAEARACGCRVVASNIAPFREQADDATFFYRALSEFKSAVARCERYPASAPQRIPPEHDVLKAEIRRFLAHFQ